MPINNMFLSANVTSFLLFLLLLLPALPRQQSPTPTVVEALEFTAGEIFPDLEKQIGSGLEGKLVSTIITAPVPFNILIPSWQGDGRLELDVRTSLDGKTWHEWQHSHLNEDWREPGAWWAVGDMVLVAGARKTHRFVQLQLQIEPTTTPLQGHELGSIRLTFIDSSEGPTAEELVTIQSGLDSINGRYTANGYPKPPVISRGAWCTEPGCIYNATHEHAPVTHQIIHHTVTANSNANWAAVVRAIWAFHTRQNGWRDIGYNYLIDPNGIIYEGHAGGDDVVGIHSSAANKGSMGVGLLGTFSGPPAGIQPPQPMLGAAVNLLSWKSDQRNINIFESSRTLPNVPWGLPHLMGASRCQRYD